MKNFLLVFFSLSIFMSCFSDTSSDRAIPDACVGPEKLPDNPTGFWIFEPGDQEFGFARGTKINQRSEWSVLLNTPPDIDSSIHLTLIGYWPPIDKPNGGLYFPRGEKIFIGPFFPARKGCYQVGPSSFSKDSVRVDYGIINDDVGILNYELDLSADNAFEIVSFDPGTKKFRGKLKASFVANREFLPDLPKRVRFVDVYIEHGY